MKKLSLIGLIMAGMMVACQPFIQTTQPAKTESQLSTTPTQVTSQTSTPPPSPTLTHTPLPAPTLTSKPPSENNLVFEHVSQLGGSINGITIVGDVAYVGMGPRVAAIDISDHQNPQLIGQSDPLPGLVTQLVQVSNGAAPLLAISAGKYLVVIDTSNPDGLKSIHQLELPGTVSAMVWDYRLSILYAGGSTYQAPYEYSGFIAALGLTLDNRLKLMNSVSLPKQPVSIALAEGGLFAATVSYTGGLYYIKLETPGELSTPHLVIASSTDNGFAPYSLQVVGDRLYAGVNMDLQAYDITDPERTVQVWKEFVGFMAMSFSFNGTQIDIFGWGAAGTYLPGQDVFTAPQPITGIPTGEVASITTSHQGDFLVAYQDLEIYTPDDAQGLELVGSYQPAVIDILGAASDEHAVYVVDNGTGDGKNTATLQVFSLPNLQPVGQVATDVPNSWGWFSGLAVEGERAYLAAIDGLWVYDLSSPSPTLLNKLDIIDGQLNAITAIKLGDRRILILSQEPSDLSVLTAYDLTDVQRPVRMGSLLTVDQGPIYQMTWNGSSLYAVRTAIYESDSDLLYLIGFDGEDLALRGKKSLPGSIFSMAVDNGLVALTGTDGLALVSALDAQSPQIEAEVALPEPGSGVAIVKDTAVVITGGNNGAAQLLAFDVHNPTNPRQVKSMDIAFSASLIGPIPASNPYIILAKGSAGMEVLEALVSSTCLDAQAKPVDVPARKEPLEVRFISNGNIWDWVEGMPAMQISDTGDALHFTFSPDGDVVVFERTIGSYPYDYKIELWAVDRDGSNLRKLVGVEQFDQFLPGREWAWVANLPRDYRWFDGTHELSFGVYPFINAVGGSDAAQDYWIVNADNLELKKWVNPDFTHPDGPKEISSPDGKVIALVDMESISLLNSDGSIIRKDALIYPANRNSEGPGWGPPQLVWTPDSRALNVVVWDEDVFDGAFSTWEIPADGSPARKLHTFLGMEYFSSISPNQEYIAYLRRERPMSNENELHLAKFDGSEDVIYAKGYQLELLAWVPDSYHFAYDLFATNQPLFGSLCGNPVALVDKSETPATQITWVDDIHFLFISGQEGQPRELRLGQVSGESLLINPFNGEGAYFQVRQEGQDVIVP
jgi:hypothetical protein